MAGAQSTMQLPKADTPNVYDADSQEASTVLSYLKLFGGVSENTQDVREALKTFQKQSGLKQTDGDYDKETADQLLEPTCGLGHKLVENFEAAPTKWPKDHLDLTFCFDQFSQKVKEPQARPVITAAFEKWSAVSPLTFREVPNTRNADIRIGWYQRNHLSDDNPFDGRGSFGAGGQFSNVLAHAFFPPPNAGDLSGDVHFDEDDQWTVALLENVALHEIGHSLGLNHSKLPTAVMYFQSNGVTALQQDDIDGIRSIYP